MLERKIYRDLVNWKGTPNHKAMVIKGARQVGKTFIIREFARSNYAHYIEINFVTQAELKEVFKGTYSVDDLLARIILATGDTSLVPSSLIFLDEIQECPEARSCLKAFTEDGRYDVIASGSMLGVSESRLGVFKKCQPLHIGVGYEDIRIMHALDFEEYLWSRGVTREQIDLVRGKIHCREPLDRFVLDVFSKHFRTFMVTGGMPEVVDLLSRGDNSGAVQAMERILASTREDINRYNEGADILKTSRCFDSIPSQLGDINKKFTFSRIFSDDGRPDRSTRQKYMDNTEWLGAAGYGNFCFLLRHPAIPLRSQETLDQYKVYLFDTGMLVQMYGPSARVAILTGDYSFNQGAMTENIVAECLQKSGYQPRCYRKTNGDNRMELDFVIELGTELALIEVKSGKHRESPSMAKGRTVFRFDRCIMLENGNISVDADGVEHYPLFAAAFIRDMVIPKDGFDENGLPVGGL